jgi:hypothetical protein
MNTIGDIEEWMSRHLVTRKNIPTGGSICIWLDGYCRVFEWGKLRQAHRRVLEREEGCLIENTLSDEEIGRSNNTYYFLPNSYVIIRCHRCQHTAKKKIEKTWDTTLKKKFDKLWNEIAQNQRLQRVTLWAVVAQQSVHGGGNRYFQSNRENVSVSEINDIMEKVLKGDSLHRNLHTSYIENSDIDNPSECQQLMILNCLPSRVVNTPSTRVRKIHNYKHGMKELINFQGEVHD